MRRKAEPEETALRDAAGPRPLPPDLWERLERALLTLAGEPLGGPPARADGGTAGDDDETARVLTGIGAPRPVPEPARARVGHALVLASARAFRGLDAPRPLPAAVRARAAEAMAQAARPVSAADAAARQAAVRPAAARAAMPGRAGRRVTSSWQAMSAVAAVVLTVASAAFVLRVATNDPAPSPFYQPPAASPGAPPGGSERADAPEMPDPTSTAEPGLPAAGEHAGAPALDAPRLLQPGGPAPPFAFSPSLEALAPASPAPGRPGAPSGPAPPPLRIGFVAGDPEIEQGVRAYVDLLNRPEYRVRGRTLHLVRTSAGHPARDTIATLNLSREAISDGGGLPGWVRPPLLETLAVPDAALRRSVFGMASAPERQGHLLVADLFPEPSPGATAVIYQAPSGIFGDRVPAEIERALRARGVAAVRVVYRPGEPLVQVPADAVILSLDAPHAGPWVAEAESARYSPMLGALYPLLDESLVGRLPPGARVVSPYDLPDTPEGRYLRSATDPRRNARSIHGWVTAKSLAVALWRSGATTPGGVESALRALIGYDPGFAPPYEVRPGTNSRTPEGMIFTVRRGRFTARSGFHRDDM